MDGTEFDYVICGGGSAGCVLAGRLSARPGLRVALIEAGPDTPPDAVPPDVRHSYHGYAIFNPAYLWDGLRVHLRPVPHNRPEERPPLRFYEQARVMGGGSSVNAQLANRGVPSDYDDWAAMGAAGWDWSGVLPYFRKLERDCDFAGHPVHGALHGADGPIPIRRVPEERWPPHSLAVKRAFAESGLPFIADQNAEFGDGWFPLSISNAPEDHRVSAAVGYLDAEVRARPNLSVLAGHKVRGLEFDGEGRAAGVRVRAPDGSERVLAARAEVIVSMGALHSPASLMRGGIGPAAALREAGVAVRRVLPGVGRNLQEHPTIGMAAYLRREHRQAGPLGRSLHVAARWSSNLPGVPRGDMFALGIPRTGRHAVGHRLAGVTAWVNKSYSQGQVRLASPDPDAAPIVELNLLSDQRDAVRLVDALRRLAAWHALPGLQGVALDPFPMAYTDAVRRLAQPTARNKALTRALAAILDGPGLVRRAAIGGVITEAGPLAALLADEEALEEYVRSTVTGQWHASCTCRMGADGDPMAVTDSAGRVRGVPGLRVCDASVMPAVPSANTNIPTLMVAEKIADAVLRG